MTRSRQHGSCLCLPLEFHFKFSAICSICDESSWLYKHHKMPLRLLGYLYSNIQMRSALGISCSKIWQFFKKPAYTMELSVACCWIAESLSMWGFSSKDPHLCQEASLLRAQFTEQPPCWCNFSPLTQQSGSNPGTSHEWCTWLTSWVILWSGTVWVAAVPHW